MKHPEGLAISRLEEGMLDDAGVLISGSGDASSYGLSEEALTLFLKIAGEGEQGLLIRHVPKELLGGLEGYLLELELQYLIDRERDNRGRIAFLVLSWQGKDALEAARLQSIKPPSWSARRRAAVAN